MILSRGMLPFALTCALIAINRQTSVAQLPIIIPQIGPDAFGHLATPVPVNLRDVEAAGNDIGLDSSDDATAVQAIGFDFLFYGASYNQVEISSNGFMSFNLTGEDACCSGETIPTAGGSIDNYIAGYWEDLDPSEGGVIRTLTVGAFGSREFIVGFYDVADNDDPANSVNTFEMILHEGTNNIELQYGQIQFEDVDDKVIGIENAGGTDGLELLFVESSAPFVNGDILLANQGFLITIVPEPSSILLLSLCACVGSVRRRR